MADAEVNPTAKLDEVSAEDVDAARDRVDALRLEIVEANNERLRVAASRENEVALARLGAEEAQLLLELQRAKSGMEQAKEADQVSGPVVSAQEAMEAAVRAAKADQELADADRKVEADNRQRLEEEQAATEAAAEAAAQQNAEAAAEAVNKTEGQ